MSVIPPPPPMRQPDDGCWKWGIFGCGGLGCVAVLAIAGLFWTVLRSPIGKQAFSAAFQQQAAIRQLRAVGHAVDRYSADKKRYPDNLRQLIPDYLPDQRSLHIMPDATSPAIQYSKPAPNAGDSTVVLQVQITPPVAVPNAPPWIVKLRKDGQLENTEYNYTDKYGKSRRIDFGKE